MNTIHGIIWKCLILMVVLGCIFGTWYQRYQNGMISPSFVVSRLALRDNTVHFTMKERFERTWTYFNADNVNCELMLKGNRTEIQRGIKRAFNMLHQHTAVNKKKEEDYLHMTRNCDNFKEKRGYILSSLSEEEEKFPVAFSMLIFKDIEMFERLLRVIYRPQNYYCIHVDLKATQLYFDAVSSITGCFPNVFLTATRFNVTWGTFTVLAPELTCMKELLARGIWKYFINLTGQEFPLKTNYELVKILTAYNGANDVEVTRKRVNANRWKGRPAPLGLMPLKGSVHIVVNRKFVEFALNDSRAKQLVEWCKTISVPDEAFFAMLNHNPSLGVPGSYIGEPETNSETKPFLARFKNWGGLPCAGRSVRSICILSTGDLPLLHRAKQMFANKFYLDEDRVVIGCLEQRLFNNTRDEFFGLKQFDSSYYQHLGFVKNKVS